MNEKQKGRLTLFLAFMFLLGLSLIGLALFLWSVKLALLYFGLVCVYLGACAFTALQRSEHQ